MQAKSLLWQPAGPRCCFPSVVFFDIPAYAVADPLENIGDLHGSSYLLNGAEIYDGVP